MKTYRYSNSIHITQYLLITIQNSQTFNFWLLCSTDIRKLFTDLNIVFLRYSRAYHWTYGQKWTPHLRKDTFSDFKDILCLSNCFYHIYCRLTINKQLSYLLSKLQKTKVILTFLVCGHHDLQNIIYMYRNYT